MLISVRANVRTAQAASESLAKGLNLAFRSGAITGIILGLASTSREVIDGLVALGFGASLISIFARLGGGIFTKGADVGGDMVGKVEAGIPRTTRNAATIADNGATTSATAQAWRRPVRDLCGDHSRHHGLAAIFFRDQPYVDVIMALPLAICGVCVVTRSSAASLLELPSGRSVANASVSGHGTNVIQGLAVSLESTALPALTIIVGIVASFQLAGLFGIAIATTTMLGVAGMIVALDAFGPVTDNAGGIAEMAGAQRNLRPDAGAASVDVDRRFSIQLVEAAPQETDEIEVTLDEEDADLIEDGQDRPGPVRR
ncbi:Pyrophosphatase [Pyrenophora tritici-repentis]|nr:Pyrophosphatase [Pyrenophora tritici-repentis]